MRSVFLRIEHLVVWIHSVKVSRAAFPPGRRQPGNFFVAVFRPALADNVSALHLRFAAGDALFKGLQILLSHMLIGAGR